MEGTASRGVADQDFFLDGTPSITRVLRPKGEGWTETPLTRAERASVSIVYPVRLFFHERHSLKVFSSVEYVGDPGVERMEFHISVSKWSDLTGARRCTGDEGRWVLAQFGMAGQEEDNHVPSGIVRNYWRPVADSQVGLECPCKEDEPVIVEDKGDFVWRDAPQ